MIKPIIARIMLATVLLVGPMPTSSFADIRTAGQVSTNARMFEFAATNPPIGYLQFCHIRPDECAPIARGAARINMTEEAWRQLVDINDHVNALIEPATDLELHGVQEWWDYPLDNRGDCEDYVLLKRKLLIEMGWPERALLITVVRDEMGDGHAVLTAVTSAGDLILDNQHPEIRLWRDTPYSYLMRQSKRDANRWVSLQDERMAPLMPVAGMGER